VLSNFGSDDADTDTNGDGTVDVNDLLSVLSNFGGDVAAANCGGGGGLAGGNDGSAVNCCGGGGSCGFMHCPALVSSPASQPRARTRAPLLPRFLSTFRHGAGRWRGRLHPAVEHAQRHEL